MNKIDEDCVLCTYISLLICGFALTVHRWSTLHSSSRVLHPRVAWRQGKKITTSDLSFPLFYIPLSWQSKGDSCWKCTSKESATLESCSASLQVSRMNKITGHPTQLFELPLYLPSLEWFIITYDVINNGLYIYYEDVSALGYITHCDGEKDFICGFAPSRLAF